MRLFSGLFLLALTAPLAAEANTLRPTPYYGAGSLGAVSAMPLDSSSDDLFSRTGGGEGLHDGGNLYGAADVVDVPFSAPASAPVSLMPPALTANTMPNNGQTVYSDRNFSFVAARPIASPTTMLPPTPSAPVYAEQAPDTRNVQGFDNKPQGNFYDGPPRQAWGHSSKSAAHEWDNQTVVSGLPAVKDNAYFAGLDATPQQHEPYYVIASNNADWMLMWQQHMGREPPGRLIPGQVAVASLLGPRNYTGYEARVKVIGSRDNIVQVLATQATPAPQVAQVKQPNAPYAVLVVHAGSRGVEVVQNRALNTGNYNYADDPKAKSINWDPAALYASPYHEKRVVVEGGNTPSPSNSGALAIDNGPADSPANADTFNPADPRSGVGGR